MLSPRLQLIFEHLLEQNQVWDLCCDHGYLGISALKSGRFSTVHFVDQASHLVDRLRARWSAFVGLSPQLELHLQPQFYPVAAEFLEVELHGNVVIAGVGGVKILSILKSLRGRGQLKAKRLILVPQKDEFRLKQQILTEFLEYSLDQSLLVEEGPRFRQVFVLNLIHDFRMD